jgi:hypothetical protein
LGVEERKESRRAMRKRPAKLGPSFLKVLRHAIRQRHPKRKYKIRDDGYVEVLVGSRGYILEHRFMMECHLGRKLKTEEDVHHKNGKCWDNRLENLIVTTHSQHLKEHYLERQIDVLGRFKKKIAV